MVEFDKEFLEQARKNEEKVRRRHIRNFSAIINYCGRYGIPFYDENMNPRHINDIYEDLILGRSQIYII